MLRQRLIAFVDRLPVAVGLQQRLPLAHLRALLTRLNRALQPENGGGAVIGARLRLAHRAHQVGIVGVRLERGVQRCDSLGAAARIHQRQSAHTLAVGGIGEQRLLLRQRLLALLLRVAVGEHLQIGFQLRHAAIAHRLIIDLL